MWIYSDSTRILGTTNKIHHDLSCIFFILRSDMFSGRLQTVIWSPTIPINDSCTNFLEPPVGDTIPIWCGFRAGTKEMWLARQGQRLLGRTQFRSVCSGEKPTAWTEGYPQRPVIGSSIHPSWRRVKALSVSCPCLWPRKELLWPRREETSLNPGSISLNFATNSIEEEGTSTTD